MQRWMVLCYKGEYFLTCGVAVAFANIFMAKIENEILRQSDTKPIFWKRFIDGVISMWNKNRDRVEDFLLKANRLHPTPGTQRSNSRLKSQKQKLHSCTSKVYKGVRFNKESIVDVRTHFKTGETFQCTNFYSCHPSG